MFENYVFNLNTLLCIVCHHLWKYLCITWKFCVCSNLFKIGPPTRTLYYFKLRVSIYYRKGFEFDELIEEQKLQFWIVTINSVTGTMLSPKSQPIRCKCETKSFEVPFCCVPNWQSCLIMNCSPSRHKQAVGLLIHEYWYLNDKYQYRY